MQKKAYSKPIARQVRISPCAMLLRASRRAIPVEEDFDNEEDFNFATRKRRDAWTDDEDSEKDE